MPIIENTSGYHRNNELNGPQPQECCRRNIVVPLPAVEITYIKDGKTIVENSQHHHEKKHSKKLLKEKLRQDDVHASRFNAYWNGQEFNGEFAGEVCGSCGCDCKNNKKHHKKHGKKNDKKNC